MYPLKRPLDLLLTLLVLPVALPLLLLAMLALKLTQGGAVLFRQKRTGRDGRSFTFYKLRTMTDARASDGHPLPDAARLTRVGRFLRGTSLDELPQLWHVLRGQMSLVGPRPLLPRYLPRYSAVQATRHRVRPGITGWAQVNGRNAISWEEKLALDAWYAGHCSLQLDLKILWMTAKGLFRPHGIHAPGETTAPEFWGTEPPPIDRASPSSPSE